MAGGLRRGAAQDQPEAISAAAAGGPEADGAPVVACWAGRILAAGPRTAVESLLEGEGYPLSRFVRIDARGGTVTPGLIDAHTHLLFAGTQEGELE